jgi:hypothetical protein
MSYASDSYPRTVTFRPGDELGPVLRQVADLDFRGNVSDLIKTWLTERAKAAGYLTETEESQNDLAFIREIKAAVPNWKERLEELAEEAVTQRAAS